MGAGLGPPFFSMSAAISVNSEFSLSSVLILNHPPPGSYRAAATFRTANDSPRTSFFIAHNAVSGPLLPIVNLPSGFTVPEEIKEALVDAHDGSEEFINPHGVASYFVCRRVRGYGVAELSGAADTLSSQQGEHRVCIVVL